MKVSTVNLSPNLDGVGPVHGTLDRGEMTAGALSVLLTEFRLIDPALNLEHDPCVLVRTKDAWYAIRTGRGRLHLYNARDTSQPGVEMDLADLIAAIQNATPPPSASEAPEPEIQRPAPRRRKTKEVLAAALLLLGLGLNAWGIHQFIQRERDVPPTGYTPLKDDARATRYLGKLAGTYAAGSGPGSRIISLTRTGALSFDVLIQQANGEIRLARGPAQTCGFGLRPAGTVCLTTPNSGQITIGADGSLHYFGDTYRRITTLAE